MTFAPRQIAERRLDELHREAENTLVDRDVVREALTEIDGLAGLLASGEPTERARSMTRSVSAGPTNRRSTG